MITDFYCMLSGVPASGPPKIFPEGKDIPLIIDHLVDLLAKEQQPILPASEELATILNEALSLKDEISCLKHTSHGHRWTELAVVLGPFGGDGPNLKYFRLCKCASIQDRGFTKTLRSDGQWTESTTLVGTAGGLPNVFMNSLCWSYIQSWFDILPPGSGRDADQGFEKALWGMVNSRFTKRSRPCILSDLDYGPMRGTIAEKRRFWVNEEHEHEEWNVSQALKILNHSGAPQLAEAISQGLRGQDLLSPFKSDVGGWMFDAPDIWPHYEEGTPTFKFRTFDVQQTSNSTLVGCFHNLPLDVLLEIVTGYTITEIYSLSTVCKSLRNLLTLEDALNPRLRKVVLSGSLSWIRPCEMADGEVNNAQESLATWIRHRELYPSKDPFLSPHFQWIPFVYACLSSDSMRNRKRLWVMAKQLKGIWNPTFANWTYYYHGDDKENSSSSDDDGSDWDDSSEFSDDQSINSDL
ncbi:hypothetical protein DL96DRAFT_1820676 [Flagelloscypha sp. PMI_526]|nr:hypothetical protein DL96DRAFT_1820676 [Flagelloscypha sp. PMI_526]